MATPLQDAVESQFDFALRNGSATLSINGQTVEALIVEPPVTVATTRRGRQRGMKRAIAGVLKKSCPIIPSPGTPAKLDDWNCVVSEEGIEEETFAYRIFLRSP